MWKKIGPFFYKQAHSFINRPLNQVIQSLQLLLLCANMNLFRSLHTVGQFLQNTREVFRGLVEFKEPAMDVGQEQEKKDVNDVTMVSEGKLQEDSFVSNANSLLSQPQRQISRKYEPTGLFGSQSSFSLKKRHIQELFYNSQGELIEPSTAKRRYESEQLKSRKRATSFQVQTFEEERERMFKRYIQNGEISKERQQNLAEIKAVLAQRNKMKDEEEAAQSIFRVVLRQTRVKESIKTYDLPQFGDFQANYTLEELQDMDYEQLSSVPSLTISNRFGMIQFLQPVNLIRKDLRHLIFLTLHDVTLKGQLRSKRIRLIIFTSFRSSENISSITERITALGLRKKRSDSSTGALTFTYRST